MLAKVLASALAAGLVAGCVPTTTYRNTGLVPAAHALPWDGRTVPAGSIRVEGTFVAADVAENDFPQVGDTALYVPHSSLEGAMTMAVAQGVELGVRVAYARFAWAEPSALGTLPLAGNPTLWGAGPEIRISLPLGRGTAFALGLGGNVMDYRIPYAEWQADSSCTPSPTCTQGYSLAEQQSSGHITLNLAIYPSVAIGPGGRYGHFFAGLSAHSGFKNDGFTNTPEDDEVKDAGIIFVGAVGYGVQYGALLASAIVELPVTSGSDPPIGYLPGASFTVGFNFDPTIAPRALPSANPDPAE
jgi:hypothetical protein